VGAYDLRRVVAMHDELYDRALLRALAANTRS
jgi:hypothetical protein